MLVGADEKKMEQVRVAMLKMIRGWNQHHVASIVRETLDEIVTPIIYAEALDLIDMHHAEGRKVVIVSSAPEEVVRPLGEFLGVDDVIATRAAVDTNGDYTGDLEFYGYGPHKADALRALAAREDIDLAESYAYSDSITDEPMLRAVGHPVAVNPDRDLARLARAPKGGASRTSSTRCASATACRSPRWAPRSRWAARWQPPEAWRHGGGCADAPVPRDAGSRDEMARRRRRIRDAHRARTRRARATSVCRLVLMAFGVRPRGPCGPR